MREVARTTLRVVALGLALGALAGVLAPAPASADIAAKRAAEAAAFAADNPEACALLDTTRKPAPCWTTPSRAARWTACSGSWPCSATAPSSSAA
ncbi:MAG: hypothetical protein H6Q03_1367 [Acidobacteria bacterium]|nr:hypothetical protein [Acidobacteriota bacterium]